MICFKPGNNKEEVGIVVFNDDLHSGNEDFFTQMKEYGHSQIFSILCRAVTTNGNWFGSCPSHWQEMLFGDGGGGQHSIYDNARQLVFEYISAACSLITDFRILCKYFYTQFKTWCRERSSSQEILTTLFQHMPQLMKPLQCVVSQEAVTNNIFWVSVSSMFRKLN